jgi:hypothetical protein
MDLRGGIFVSAESKVVSCLPLYIYTHSKGPTNCPLQVRILKGLKPIRMKLLRKGSRSSDFEVPARLPSSVLERDSKNLDLHYNSD